MFNRLCESFFFLNHNLIERKFFFKYSPTNVDAPLFKDANETCAFASSSSSSSSCVSCVCSYLILLIWKMDPPTLPLLPSPRPLPTLLSTYHLNTVKTHGVTRSRIKPLYSPHKVHYSLDPLISYMLSVLFAT